ncbi:MAG: chemotaxis protein CheX [Armatimonadota bacterium]|jgi:chemotaxis protein CheX
MTTPKRNALNADHVRCVVDAVGSAMSWVAGEEPQLRGEEPVERSLRCEGVVGCISLVGDVDWSLVLSIPRATASELAGRFAGFEIPFDSADMGDAVGEMANLLAGEVKVQLDGIGLAAEISLPQVFRGEIIEVLQLPHVPAELLRFECSCGPLWVAIAQSG